MPQNCKDIFDIASLDISSCYKAVVIQKKMGIGTGRETQNKIKNFSNRPIAYIELDIHYKLHNKSAAKNCIIL